MEIILKQDVEKLGFKDELVKVKDGYGRNFLIPRGMAIIANSSNKKVLQENLKQRAKKDAKLKEEAMKIVEALKNEVITVAVKAGEKGKIFGSVNTIMLADSLQKAGHSVDRKYITIRGEAIKQLGKYDADVRLHREVSASFKFEVVAE
jgi:large subunit ribosomal protein L9